ncbi:hypothetical protein Y1Q_0005591 [Alligator mississippiensis]|uniref:Uncharacterized protein n=1 Tax=Alligator mississippiensis TaxID=8496 RepID=A0A151MF57_ALLMI|nr:hypothetical protein Y1Q_0005591 [Alligator mississippiensis]
MSYHKILVYVSCKSVSHQPRYCQPSLSVDPSPGSDQLGAGQFPAHTSLAGCGRLLGHLFLRSTRQQRRLQQQKCSW